MDNFVLNKLRGMSDEELKHYLKCLSGRAGYNCIKCGKANSNYTMNIQNKKKSQQKKLCTLCESCYNDLLDYLGTYDIMWE